MATKQLRYIGPISYVDVPILGRQGEPFDDHGVGCVVQGEVFECDADIAGSPPKVTKDGEIKDYGSGLLAQTENFELADKPARKNDSEA